MGLGKGGVEDAACSPGCGTEEGGVRGWGKGKGSKMKQPKMKQAQHAPRLTYPALPTHL